MRTILVMALLAACGDGDGGGGDVADADPFVAEDGGPVDGAGADLAADLLALTDSCATVVGGDYATDQGDTEIISVCGLTGAIFWRADLDVDGDGIETTECNAQTDPSFLPQTAATDSNGEFLNAAALPYVVVPSPSARWDYRDSDLHLGTVVAVIYAGQVRFGVIGDTGPVGIIGEASYAMAAALGIDPDPAIGGSDGPVTYIAFTGSAAVQDPIEDHAATTALGQSLAAALLAAP
jgi:hypothetical protein